MSAALLSIRPGFYLRNAGLLGRAVLLLAMLCYLPCARVFADSQFTGVVTRLDDEWIATLIGVFRITDEASFRAEVDTTGYLGIGVSYDFLPGRFLVEPYAGYGRSENLDIYDIGVFTARQVAQKVYIYFSTAHEWRRTKGFPILELDVLDQTEWRSSLGGSWLPLKWLDVSYAFSHDRLLSGDRGITEVENRNISNHRLMATFVVPWVEPFVRYTWGKHRVRPGEPITAEGTLEVGLNVAVP